MSESTQTKKKNRNLGNAVEKHMNAIGQNNNNNNRLILK